MRLHSRLVKEGFWTDTELIRELPLEGRLFYLGLIQLADDSGCLENDVMAFKILLFPGDPNITEDLLEEFCKKLVRMGKLTKYLSVNKECYYLKNFHKHQTIKNPSPPEVPLPPWIKWEPYKSNPRAGKYSIGNVSDFCKKSVSKVSDSDILQSSSNINRNINRNINTCPNSSESAHAEIATNSQEDEQSLELTPKEPTATEKKIKYPEDSEAYQLSAYLRQKIIERDPSTKVPPDTVQGLQRWAIDADRMIRLDNRDPTEARELIAWSQQDDFWSANILSMSSFRKQYDRLKRQQTRKGPRKPISGSKDGDPYAEIYL